MIIQQRKDRQGNIYFSFLYKDEKTGKKVRLKKTEHPHFDNLADAEAWAKSQEAYRNSRKAYIARKVAWKTQYYQFDQLKKKYEAWQKERAPNSYATNIQLLEQYVFDFFLNDRKSSNVNDWHLIFQDFNDWLKEKINRTDSEKLAFSSCNNIIRTLNTFLECLKQYNLIDPDSVKKCPAFPEHKLNRRGFESYIDKDELKQIRFNMEKYSKSASDFFYILWYTGMRFAELFGLPTNSLFKGDIPTKSLHDELVKCDLKYYGYIRLESQPYYDDRKREEDKSLRRKPLKGNKSIDPKYTRIIPIFDKEVWNILATRYKNAKERLFKIEYTTKLDDYCFFDDLEWNKAVESLKKAYQDQKLEPKSYHCCRHSFVTRLIGETRSFFLVRAITGHRKDKSFERYLHIFEQLAQESLKNTQEIDVI